MTIDEMRREINRLTNLLKKKSDEYDQRERVIEQRHESGHANYTGDLYTLKKRDLVLADLSGASKTIAAILTAYAATLSAEVAWHESALSKPRVVSTRRPITHGAEFQ